MIVIFDWDGTLCDSVEQIVSAMQDATAELSLPAPAATEIRNVVGLGLPQAVSQLFPGLDEATRNALTQAYSRHYSSPDRPSTPLFTGAMETLLALRERGFELAVATGKSRRGLDRVMASLGLDGFFEATRCADETQSKPHPQMVLEIMASRGKAAEDALVVGDTEYDLVMARRARARSVGVSFGVHSRERLARHQPLAIIDELPRLLDLAALGGESN
jgi:phosphoglycolate phosphatase